MSALHTLMPNSLSALAGSLKHLVLSNNLLEEVPSFALRQLRWGHLYFGIIAYGQAVNLYFLMMLCGHPVLITVAESWTTLI